MSFLRKTICLFSLLSLLIFPVWGKVDYRIEDQPSAIEQAMRLPHQGTLKQKENGFVYVDVSNDFIELIVAAIDHAGELRQIPTGARSMGAHISVFHEDESVTPQELDQSFPFEVKEIRSFTLNTRDGLKKQWVIAVDSPELEQLRVSYGCSPKLKGYDFHISLGKLMPTAPEGWQSIEVFSELSFFGEPVEGMYSNGDFIKVEHEEVLATAAKVNAVGQLCLKGNGFVYLDVDNDFVDRIVEKLPVEGPFTPISTKAKQMGAHISVIYEDEMVQKEIWELKEAGQWFTFEVKELRYFSRTSVKEEKRLWLLAADSPGLQRLRMKYGLKPKLKGHDFHITLGSEKVEIAAENDAA